MENVDSVYNFSKKLSGQYRIFKIDSAIHEDFSCLSVVVGESGNCLTSNCFNTSLKLVLPFLNEHLKNNKSFSKALDIEINKTIKEISKSL